MQRFSKVFALTILLSLSLNLFGCKENALPETSVSMASQTTQNLETFYTDDTASTKKQLEGYEYTVLNSKTIILPILLDEYIEETEDGGYKYLMGKLLTDYGWQKKDYDGDGQFTIPKNDLMSVSYDSLIKDGDYFYYDCGDMWVRLLILNYVDSEEPLVLVPDWIDYSFILPDSPGEYYFNHVIFKPYPYNNTFAEIYKNNETRYLTDLEDIVISYDYFVIMAFVITWPSIDPYENPFYYLPYDSHGPIEVVKKEILRDEYAID